jgi:gamma-glutamylcyclotransferase
MQYFAYGSNMCTKRLRSRVPSAMFVSTAALEGYQFRFHKGSRDGSGKGNVLRTDDPGDVVLGVIFTIDAAQKRDLDRAEGLDNGYHIEHLTVRTATGDVPVFTYIADDDAIDEALLPYSWYKDLVIAGATVHGLSQAYIDRMVGMPAKTDPDLDREARELAFLPCTA